MTIILSKINDFYKLYSIIQRELTNQQFDILIEKNFLEPTDILILTQFIIIQKQKICDITIQAKTEILDYLKAICIVDFCNKNYVEPNTILAVNSYSAMPIRRVEEATMYTYINSTQDYFKSFCDGKDLGMLNLCLSELINNVYNHSHSPIGAYVFAQYYQKLKEIRLAVSDLGIGIPMSVNTYKKENKEQELSSKDCISWAIKENMTTKSIPQNKGKGLDTIKSFMKSNNCTWKLYSEDILMNGFPQGNKYEKNPISFFKGTLVQLNIKINNLLDEKIEDELDWFNS